MRDTYTVYVRSRVRPHEPNYFTENLRKVVRMREQFVPGRIFRPGNEANPEAAVGGAAQVHVSMRRARRGCDQRDVCVYGSTV